MLSLTLVGRSMRRLGLGNTMEGTMRPVQPGWIIVPATVPTDGTELQWHHLVGWNHLEPVIQLDHGIGLWRDTHGTDPWCIATLAEWGKL